MEDILDVIDEDGDVTGQATYSECHAKGYWHRAVEVAIYRRKLGSLDLLVQRRSPEVRFFPGVLDLFGGHVQSGESYEQAAGREAEEESGLTGFVLEPLTRRTRDSSSGNRIDREHITVFAANCSDNPAEPVGQAGEVGNLAWFPLKDIMGIFFQNPEDLAPGLGQLLAELLRGHYTLP